MIAGNCIEIESEICEDKVSGTVITLISITDPNSNVITLNQVMVFDDNIASTTYQLSLSATPGRWKFICQSVNQTKINYAEGYFFVEAQ